jgi:hypothetical protein
VLKVYNQEFVFTTGFSPWFATKTKLDFSPKEKVLKQQGWAKAQML